MQRTYRFSKRPIAHSLQVLWAHWLVIPQILLSFVCKLMPDCLLPREETITMLSTHLRESLRKKDSSLYGEGQHPLSLEPWL